MNFKPLNEFVLVKLAPVEEKTKSGLYMPGGNGTFLKAEVTAVSNGVLREDGTMRRPLVSRGDQVVLLNTDPRDKPGLAVPDSELRMVREAEIIGVCEGSS